VSTASTILADRQLLRATAYGADRGLLAARSTFAVRDIVTAVNVQAGHQYGDDLTAP
jgi:hypothetical protein